MNPYAILPLISFIFLLGAAAYVLKRNIRGVFNWMLGSSILILCTVEFGGFMALISPAQDGALFWERWVFAGLCLLPLSWTILSLTFARENYQVLLRRWGWYLILLSIATLGFLANLARESLISGAEAIPGGCYGFALGTAGRFFFVFLLLSLVVILLNFENTYRSSYGTERDKIKYAIRGITIFLASYIVLSSLALLFSYIDARFIAVGSAAIVVGTLMVIYSVFRYGFMDVDIYIGRQVVYTSTTLTIVGLYLFMIGLITKIVISTGIDLKTFLSFLAALFVFLLFLTIVFSKLLKERIRLFIDKSLYKGKYDYRHEWGSFSEKISSIFSLDELLLSIVDAIHEIMNIENISIMLLDEDRNRFFVAKGNLAGRGQSMGSNNEIYLHEKSEFIDWLWRHGQPLEIRLQKTPHPNPLPRGEREIRGNSLPRGEREKVRGIEDREKLENLGAAVCVPLIAKQKLIGILNVGKKPLENKFTPLDSKHLTGFTNEDFELLKRIADQAAIAILNARLSEELIIAREMESIQKFSSFIIHDLKNFVSMLSMVVQNASSNIENPEFRKDSLDTISDTIGKMNNLMSKMSTLPERLELRRKLGDLSGLINEVLAKSKVEGMSRISVVKELGKLPPIRFDYEYLYKVVLNLVLNAVESLNGRGQVRISTSQGDGFVHLTISDTGCGMSREYIQRHLFKPFQTTKKKGLGIGLYQCKSIVEAHGGTIEVESRKNEGTTFVVKLPLGN